MQKTDEIKKELKDISPKMAEISKEEVFKVKDGYFSQLADQVQNRISKKSIAENVIRGHFFRSTTLKWIAASVAILILGSAYYYKAWISFDPGNYTNTESYIIENIDEGTITDYFSEIQNKNGKKIEILDNSLENIDEDLIIEEF